MVSGADCRLAQAHLSRRYELPGVTRDDLSQPRSSSPAAPPMKELPEHFAALTSHASSRATTRRRRAITARSSATVSISERPAQVEDRAVPGHWEGDLLFGSKNSQIATLVERQTRYVMLVKVGGKDTQTVINALIKSARKLLQELYKSLSPVIEASEMADHQRFTLATDIKVYFVVIRQSLATRDQ